MLRGESSSSRARDAASERNCPGARRSRPDVALNALTPKCVEGTAAEIAAASGCRVVPVVADATKPEEVRHAVDSILATLGQIGVLVNALGDSIRKPLVAVRRDWRFSGGGINSD
jgi:NAD(P)-dependent dehydrogenase (short-subunit alcohol dehydrogenase family)